MRVSISTNTWTFIRTRETGATIRSGSFTERSHTRSDITRTLKDATGWREPSSYTSTLVESKPFVGDGSFIHRRDGSGNFGRFFKVAGSFAPPPVQEPDAVSSNTENALLAAALVSIKDQKVNIGTTLAEMAKTVAGVEYRALQLFRAYTAARKGNWKLAAKLLGVEPKSYKKGSKAFASGWLELQYGWLPILSDIHGAYEEITKKARTERMLVVGRASRKTDSTLFFPWTVSPYNSVEKFSGDLIDIKRTTQKVSLWYELDLPLLATAATVGLTNPLEILWELTPWSFVADWLIPVGDVLSALDTSNGLKYLGGSHTHFGYRCVTGNLPAVLIAPDSGWIPSSKIREGLAAKTVMVRKVYTTSPIPKPFYKNPLSVGHAINAVALLRSIKR